MQLAPLSIVALAGIAMFSLQISGLHIHANAEDEIGDLHGAHVHNLDSDGHNHSADIDVSVFDPGIVWYKLMLVLLLVMPIILVVIWSLRSFWPPPLRHYSPRWRTRWRPPLRAPPLSP